MFDVSASEILVVGAVALVVIGPKELPGVLRMVGQMVGKLKRMAGEFRQQFDDAIREADLHDIKNTVSDAVNTASAATAFNPMNTIRNEIKSTVDELKGVNRTAADDAAKPAEQGPPVSIIAPPVPEPAMPVFTAEAAPVPVAEKPPVAKAKPKKTAKKPAGDVE